MQNARLVTENQTAKLKFKNATEIQENEHIPVGCHDPIVLGPDVTVESDTVTVDKHVTVAEPSHIWKRSLIIWVMLRIEYSTRAFRLVPSPLSGSVYLLNVG